MRHDFVKATLRTDAIGPAWSSHSKVLVRLYGIKVRPYPMTTSELYRYMVSRDLAMFRSAFSVW